MGWPQSVDQDCKDLTIATYTSYFIFGLAKMASTYMYVQIWKEIQDSRCDSIILRNELNWREGKIWSKFRICEGLMWLFDCYMSISKLLFWPSQKNIWLVLIRHWPCLSFKLCGPKFEVESIVGFALLDRAIGNAQLANPFLK